jgi:prepilin-type N-terminal cleavage/methylation domain-containing protein
MITKERIELVGGGGNRSRGRGFTLIEILIVVAIIAILASVVLVGLGPTQREGRDSRRISDLAEVQNGLELFYNNCGFYPGSSPDNGSACPTDWGSGLPASNGSYETMKAEVTGLAAIGVTQIPEDPSGGNFVYQYESVTQNSYTLAATLEDTGNAALRSDEQSDPNGGTLQCGQAGLYCLSL